MTNDNFHSFSQYLSQFGHIEEKALADLASHFSFRNVDKNVMMTEEGEYASEFGFIQSGIVRAYIRNEEGKDKIIHESLTECSLLVAPYDQVVSLYDQYHSLERIGRKIAEFYYIEKERKLIEQAILDAEKRYIIFKEHFAHIENDIPQYHIASYVGVTPTQLSRIRRKMSEGSSSLHM